MKGIIPSFFQRKQLKRKHNYFVFVRYDSKTHYDSTNMLAKSDIIKILEILIGSIFVLFGGRVFQ
jgi:hypothetical protein